MPYGMTSNQGNMHDIFSFHFLQACYAAEDWTLARKVNASHEERSSTANALL